MQKQNFLLKQLYEIGPRSLVFTSELIRMWESNANHRAQTLSVQTATNPPYMEYNFFVSKKHPSENMNSQTIFWKMVNFTLGKQIDWGKPAVYCTSVLDQLTVKANIILVVQLVNF